MSSIQKIRSESGFTLVEMMVVAGILSMLMLAFSAYMYYQTKMSKTQEARQNMNYLESTVINASGSQETLIKSENLKK